MKNVAAATRKMIGFYHGNKHDIAHFLKVWALAKTIGELAGYIRRFAALFSGGVPVEGHMGGVAFCATEQPGGGVRVHWVQVDRQRIPVDATV